MYMQWNIIQPQERKLAICDKLWTRIDLEGVILSEISQTEKDKYYMIVLVYGI